MWQALVRLLWMYVQHRAEAHAHKLYHKRQSRHAKSHRERIQPWAPIARKIEIIISGQEVIVCHRSILV